jgi:hypothetical protein
LKLETWDSELKRFRTLETQGKVRIEEIQNSDSEFLIRDLTCRIEESRSKNWCRRWRWEQDLSPSRHCCHMLCCCLRCLLPYYSWTEHQQAWGWFRSSSSWSSSFRYWIPTNFSLPSGFETYSTIPSLVAKPLTCSEHQSLQCSWCELRVPSSFVADGNKQT